MILACKPRSVKQEYRPIRLRSLRPELLPEERLSIISRAAASTNRPRFLDFASNLGNKAAVIIRVRLSLLREVFINSRMKRHFLPIPLLPTPATLLLYDHALPFPGRSGPQTSQRSHGPEVRKGSFAEGKASPARGRAGEEPNKPNIPPDACLPYAEYTSRHKRYTLLPNAHFVKCDAIINDRSPVPRPPYHAVSSKSPGRL
jgi:hypothetical protein